jgi:hypothetical protein
MNSMIQFVSHVFPATAENATLPKGWGKFISVTGVNTNFVAGIAVVNAVAGITAGARKDQH